MLYNFLLIIWERNYVKKLRLNCLKLFLKYGKLIRKLKVVRVENSAHYC